MEEDLYNCSYLEMAPEPLGANNMSCHIDRESASLISNIVNQFFYAITFFVGLCGNTLVIYVVSRFSKMQTVTNMYILNLALADEIFLLGIPFLIATVAIDYWAFGDTMCKLYMVTTSLNQFTSSLFLTIMSADRYIAVCHPINSPKYRTPMISKLVSLTAWSISALMVVPMFMYATTIVINGKTSCNAYFPDFAFAKGHKIFTLYTFVLSFGMPFTLIFIFYCLVIFKLRSVGPKSRSKEKKKSHRKVTKMVLTVILVYLFCWLPYWINQITLISTEPGKDHSNFEVFIFLFSSCLSYLNSAMNPILYAFLSDNFKKSFMKACLCVTGRDSADNQNQDNSLLCKRRRSGQTSRTPFTAQDIQSREGTSTACPMSKEVSTAMTMLSRTPSQVRNEDHDKSFKNGRLLEVPTIHNSQL